VKTPGPSYTGDSAPRLPARGERREGKAKEGWAREREEERGMERRDNSFIAAPSTHSCRPLCSDVS